MCEIVAKQICNKCGEGIFRKVIKKIDKGKTPFWNDKKKKWKHVKYYHPECTPRDPLDR